MIAMSTTAFDLLQLAGGGVTFEELLARPAWMRDALCSEPAYDPEWWFPGRDGDGPSNARKAIAVCERCLVRRECFTYAMADPNMVGIWGGTSKRDRARIRALRALPPAA